MNEDVKRIRGARVSPGGAIYAEDLDIYLSGIFDEVLSESAETLTEDEIAVARRYCLAWAKGARHGR